MNTMNGPDHTLQRTYEGWDCTECGDSWPFVTDCRGEKTEDDRPIGRGYPTRDGKQ